MFKYLFEKRPKKTQVVPVEATGKVAQAPVNDPVLSLTDSESDSDKESRSSSIVPTKKMPEVEALTLFADYLYVVDKHSASNDKDASEYKRYKNIIRKMVELGAPVLNLPNERNEIAMNFYLNDIQSYDKSMKALRLHFSSESIPHIFGEKTALFAYLFRRYLKRFVDKSLSDDSAYFDIVRSDEVRQAKKLYTQLELHFNEKTAHMNSINTTIVTIYRDTDIHRSVRNLNKKFESLSEEAQDDMLYEYFLELQHTCLTLPREEAEYIDNAHPASSDESPMARIAWIAEEKCPIEYFFLGPRMERVTSVVTTKRLAAKIMRESEEEDASDEKSVSSYTMQFFSQAPLEDDNTDNYSIDSEWICPSEEVTTSSQYRN